MVGPLLERRLGLKLLLTRVAVLAGLFWLALMVSFTLADVFTRSWIRPPGP